MAGVQRRSSSTAGVKGSSRKAAEPPLIVLPISIWRPLAQNTSSRSSKWGDMGDDRFKAEGGEDSLLTNAELAVGAVSSIF